MPIRSPSGPHDEASVLAEAVRQVLPTQLAPLTTAYDATGGSPPTPVASRATLRQRVYTALARDVLAGAITTKAKRDGWRYILLADEKAVAAPTIYEGTAGSTIATIDDDSTATFVKTTLDAFLAAEQLPGVSEGDYELRFLMISDVGLVALWLRGNPDIFIPIDPAPAAVKANQAYSEKEILAALTPTAIAVVGTDNAPRSTPPAVTAG